MIRRPPRSTLFPYTTPSDLFPAGQRIRGKITNLVPYGAFVEIEEGVEGLIHVSELSWTKRIMQIGRATSELQSHVNLVCRLLLEKKKKKKIKKIRKN